MKNRILQLKKIACAAGIVVLMAGGAEAALVIDFTNVDPNVGVGAVNVGTLTAGQTLGDGEAFSSLSYTVSGLTIDGDGTANDSIVVTLGVSALGTGTPTIDWDVIEFDHNDGVFNVAGEGISFGAIGVTGTLSGGDPLVVNSAVYTEWSFRRWANAVDEVATIEGDVTAAFDYSGISPNVTLNDTTFSVTHFSGGSWNGNDISFSVDVDVVSVPEPSSLALLGLGVFGVGMRRRRRA